MLGKLSPEEEAEVARHAEAHPEIARELSAIEEALQEYALLHGKTPPPGVLSAVLQRIQAEQQPPLSAPGKRPLRLLAYAVGILLVAALTGLAIFYQRSEEQQSTITNLQQELDSIQAQCDTIQQSNQQLRNELGFLQRPGTQPIAMNGTELSPNSRAKVYYNTEEQSARLGSIQLPAPPSDKQYQLWAIVEGNPVSMGVFDIQADTAGLKDVPYVENAQAFAVTLEDRGGSPAPTLEQMYVIGNRAQG